MEGRSRQRKTQRNLSPETKRKTAKSQRFSSQERSLNYQRSQAGEMNDRRKYKREKRKDEEERRSKDNRKSQSKEAEINRSVGRNRQHKEYKNHGLKSQDRPSSKHLSPKHSGQHNKESTGTRKSRNEEAVSRQLNEMITIEWHHTKYVDRSTSSSAAGEIRYVHWCPQYINPDTRGHVRGGKTLPHHRCRECRQLCFHLLGRPGTRRLCLACSGYKTKYIPDWYYHKRCEYCHHR